MALRVVVIAAILFLLVMGVMGAFKGAKGTPAGVVSRLTLVGSDR